MVENKDHDNGKFRFFYEKSSLGYQSLNEEGHLLEVSPVWLKLMGHAHDEVIGHWFGDFLTSDSRKRFKKNFPRFKAAGEIHGVHLNMVHKDGHIIEIEANGKIAYDGKGNFKQTHCTLSDITDRKYTDEELRRSEEKYRHLVTSIPDIIWTIDCNNKIRFVSPSIEKGTGYTAEEFCKGGMSGKIHPEDNEKVGKALRELFEKGTRFDVECRFKRKDGEWIWVHIRSVATYEKNGVMHADGTASNITIRKQAEKALQESKNRYSAIIEHSKELYYIHDDQSKVNYVSPQCEQIFGYSPPEMIAKWNSLTTDNPINRKALESSRKALETGIRQEPYLLELMRKDGEKILVEVDEAPLKDKKGEVTGITGVLTDVTNSKQIENALRENEEQFRALFEYAPDAYYINDLKGIFVDGNKAAEKLTGYKKDEFIGKSFFKSGILPSNQSIKAAKLLAKNALGQPTGPDEITLRRGDGSDVTVEITTVPINIKGKRLVLGAARDITDRKKYENKIKYLSFHDSLTGLYNRAYFEEELARLDTVRQLPISIIMADLDGLKLVNDTFGHEQGDKVLCRSAKLLESCCRADDIVARWGGDEFSILLPRTTAKEADEFIKRVKNECLDADNSKIPISISLGFSTKESPDQDIREIIKKADNHMYKNKLLKMKST